MSLVQKYGVKGMHRGVRIPLEGHPYHEKPDEHLRYIMRDAGEAAQAMRGVSPQAEGKYLDQMNDASTILHYRSQNGIFKADSSNPCVGDDCGSICKHCGKIHKNPKQLDSKNTQDAGGANNPPALSKDPSSSPNQATADSNTTNPPMVGSVKPIDDTDSENTEGFNNDSNVPDATASTVVQSMGSALKHPVQINHDAEGVGVTHAAMLIHPEWNQTLIKSKIHNHLKNNGWVSGRSDSKVPGGKTYVDNNNHKIHLVPVGEHLVISSENVAGTSGTAYAPPKQSKARKFEDIILEKFSDSLVVCLNTMNSSSNY